MTDQLPSREPTNAERAQAAYKNMVRGALGFVFIGLVGLLTMLILFPPSGILLDA